MAAAVTEYAVIRTVRAFVIERLMKLVPKRLKRAGRAQLALVRGLVNRTRGNHVVHFLHIGKTGGTAIKQALEPYRDDHGRIIELHDHSFALRDVPPGEKCFFFVRDPIARFVSAFYGRRRQDQPRYNTPWTEAEKTVFAIYSTPNELAMALSSHEDSTRRSAMEAMASIRHVNTSYWKWFEDEGYLLSRSPDILFVGFQENLDADFEILKQLLELPGSLELPRDDVLAHRNPPGLAMLLDEEAIENLRGWHSRDYDFVELCQKLAEQIRHRETQRRRLAAEVDVCRR